MIAAVEDGGMSCNGAPERFGIVVSSAGRVVNAWRADGRAEALPQGGDPRSHHILAVVEAEVDNTLVKLAKLLHRQHGASFALSTIWRFLDRHGLTFKEQRTQESRNSPTSPPGVKHGLTHSQVLIPGFGIPRSTWPILSRDLPITPTRPTPRSPGFGQSSPTPNQPARAKSAAVSARLPLDHDHGAKPPRTRPLLPNPTPTQRVPFAMKPARRATALNRTGFCNGPPCVNPIYRVASPKLLVRQLAYPACLNGRGEAKWAPTALDDRNRPGSSIAAT